MSVSHLSTTDYRIPKKIWRAVLDLTQRADDFGMRRDSVFIAIGGGITMDVVGLLASIYRRGVRYIRFQTTLIGAIDAGIGVKTGVNFKRKKSLLGTFYPPI